MVAHLAEVLLEGSRERWTCPGRGVNSAPPSAIRPPLAPTGPASTTPKPRLAPAGDDRLDRGRAAAPASSSVGARSAAASRARALARSRRRPRPPPRRPVVEQTLWVCWSRNQPTAATTRTESTHDAGHDPCLDRPAPEGQCAPDLGGSERSCHAADPLGRGYRDPGLVADARGRSRRSRGSPGRARPWSAAAERDVDQPGVGGVRVARPARAGSPGWTPARACAPGRRGGRTRGG